MISKSCPECGFPLKGDEFTCPECGFPIVKENEVIERKTVHLEEDLRKPSIQTATKIDLAHYIYECGVIGWSVIKKYVCFKGRASRREYWSFFLILSCFFIPFSSAPIGILILLLPWIGVGIRRMHDIGKNGWWSICPIANLFLLLKKSDEGTNKYGEPFPAKNLL